MLIARPASLIEGRAHETILEDGARRGVPRWRFATVAPGGTGPRPPGTMTRTRGARCDRSGSNSGEGSAGPEPKIATVERREAGAPRMGRKAPRQAPGLPRYVQAQPVPRKHRTTLGAPPPLKFGGSEAKVSNPGCKNAPRERERLCCRMGDEVNAS